MVERATLLLSRRGRGAIPQLAPIPPLVPLDPRCMAPGTPIGPWRYADAFPALDVPPMSLGEDSTAFESLTMPSLPRRIRLLRDDLQPSGSWKDRGSALLVSALRAAGHTRILDDSPANAAFSLALYAQEAGLALTSFLSASTRDAVKTLVRSTGARVIEVPGAGREVAAAAFRAMRDDVVMAAPARHPHHVLGAASAAFSIVETLGAMPGVVVAPVGQGSLLTGLQRGFLSAAAAGVGPLPILIGVQSNRCCPVASAWAEQRALRDAPSSCRDGLAEAVLIERPVCGEQALAAARACGGAIVAVDDMVLDRAVRELWLAGLAVEPAAALGVAFLMDHKVQSTLAQQGEIVALITGHGMRQGLPICPGL